MDTIISFIIYYRSFNVVRLIDVSFSRCVCIHIQNKQSLHLYCYLSVAVYQ